MSTQGVKRKRCDIGGRRNKQFSGGLSTVAQWVLDSWQSIDADMVARSFKKTGISNALDGTEDDALWTADSNSRVNDDAASVDDWDTDEQMCLADYTALFGNDDNSDESDFEGF